MKKTICLLPGDGIGPEIVAQGVAVLEAVAKKFGHEFDFVPALIGGAAIDATGEPLPAATVEACRKADAVYLGAVGGPKWDNIEPARRPEKGLLGIRKALGLFANLRPALLLPELAGACLLRSDIAARGLDLIVVRELTGDIYFGEPRAIEERNGLRVGYNTMIYDENEIRRIAKVAFETARQRRKKVCSVEKSNVLETSRLWKAVVQEVHADYPDVELSHMYVDNAAMQLVRDPRSSTSSSPATSSVTSSPTRPPSSPGRWACCLPPPWAPRLRPCSSPSTVPRPTSPVRTRPIPWPPSCPPA